MKVAILFDQPHWTGLGEYAILLHKLLCSSVEEVQLLYVGAIEDKHPSYTYKTYLKRTKRWFLRPITIRKNYKRIIEDKDYGDYLFHYLGYDPYPLKLKPGIFTIHDVIKEHLSDKINLIRDGKFKEALVSIERNRQVKQSIRMSSFASAVVTISDKTGSELKHLSGITSTTIYHWIANDRFQQRDKNKALSYLKLDPKTKYILSVGNNRPNKRRDLIRNFSDCLPEGYKLIKIGAPVQSNKIINVGTVDSNYYPLYFNCSDAYLHLSEDEGFGRPLIEALASKIPIICRVNQINRELLDDTAIYINEKLTMDEALNVVSKLSDEGFLNEMQRKISRRCEFYKAEKALDKYLEIYEKKILNGTYSKL